MDAATFDAVFSAYPDPVLLRTRQGWLQNPAAVRCGFTDAELEALPVPAQLPTDAPVWIRDRFYRVTICAAGRDHYYILRKDTFMATAGEALAAQLRQKLSSALLATQMLARSAAPDPAATPAVTERLKVLNRSLYQILRIVEQLELSGAPDFNFCRPKTMELCQFLQAFSDDIADLCRQLSVRYTLDCELTSLIIKGDEEKLRYLLLNLLSNSLKALPKKDGAITLALRRQNSQAILTMTDNGSGLTPDVLTTPLWNQPELLSVTRGLGLGLPLVERIVIAHGGKIMANAVDGGSQITISLPTEDGQLLLSSPAATEREPGYYRDLITLSDVLPPDFYFPEE